MADTLTITYFDAVKYLAELQVRVPKLSEFISTDNAMYKFITDALLKLSMEDNIAKYDADLQTVKNDLAKVVDDLNNEDGIIAGINQKIDKHTTDISAANQEINKNFDASQSNSQGLNTLTQDKANKTDITRLELKIDANTNNITKLGWNPQYHEWQTFLAGLDADGNNNESSDYPPVNEPFNYALNKQYSLLDIDGAGYIMGIKTNLTEERLCFIDKLNLDGDLVRSTQTTSDWVVDVRYDLNTKATTIKVDFLKDTIRDFKLTLMRLADSVDDATIALMKAKLESNPETTLTQFKEEFYV